MVCRLAATVLALCLFASPTFAQKMALGDADSATKVVTVEFSNREVTLQQPGGSDRATVGLIKMVIGLGLLGGGAVLAATSGSSSDVCINDPILGRYCTNISVRNNSQLVSGIGLSGAGGLLIWWGAQDRRVSTSPSLIGISVANGVRVTYQRRW
jgi:hypothetical protein